MSEEDDRRVAKRSLIASLPPGPAEAGREL
jgi:hypothetical protein